GMDMAISKLNSGGWVHIFLEGSRSRDGGKTMGTAKRGIGRLILDAYTVPFVHTGMQDIMPVGANVPRIGKTIKYQTQYGMFFNLSYPLFATQDSLPRTNVKIYIGNPIHFDDLLGTEEAENVSRKHLYDAVSSRIGQRLYELKAQVDRVSLEQQSLMSQDARTSSDRAADIFHRVDWDSFGMGAHFSEESSTINKQLGNDCLVSSSLDRQIPKRGFSSEAGMSLKI
ncbi:unnamed protein product, partial [Thlaspi arvense]